MSTDNKIRVLIADDVSEARENIKKILSLDADIEVIGIARTGKESIETVKELKPDVVIMDISMPDMDGISATETIRHLTPYIQVVILSVQGDPEYMRKAMLVGARDFLTKPPAIDDLISAVKRAGSFANEEREKAAIQSLTPSSPRGHGLFRGSLGRIIAVYSPKGGVGTTTVTTNIGVTLHNVETPAVLVDAKLHFGDLAVFLNEHGKNSIADLTPRVDELDQEVIEEVLLTHKSTGIKILAAPSRPEYAEDITGEQFNKVVNLLKQLYSYVVIDCPSSMNDPVLMALQTSDIIILLTTQEIPAIKNARQFLDITDMLNVSRKKIVFVLNRYDRRIGITPEKISESFKEGILAVLPTDERLVLPSINRGVPFMLGDKSRPLSKAYLSLAEVIRQKLHEFSLEESEGLSVPAGSLRKMSK